MSETWSRLLSAALVGTDRRTAAIDPTTGPLSTVVHPEVAADGPGGLLDTAAALTVARRAGQQAATGVTAPPVAAAESRRPVPPAAANRLADLVGPNAHVIFHHDLYRQALVAEWLDLAASHGYLVPARLLPELFGLARRYESIRPALFVAGGERARWLVGARAEWSLLRDQMARQAGESALNGADQAGAVPDERIWHEGTTGERVGYLTALRRRDPDAGRDLLARSWAKEEPAERAQLLAALETGLGSADEAFCEQALDDRRKEVRATAARLLTELDGSAYRDRMAQRVLDCVGLDATGTLTVTPPAGCDKSMQRDIATRAPQGGGERAWWLSELIARAPLAAWRTIDDTPAKLTTRKVQKGWAKTLQVAWAHAAVSQRDPDWAAALLDAGVAKNKHAGSATVTSLFHLLDPHDLLARTMSAVRAPDRLTCDLLTTSPRPWPEELSHEVLRTIIAADTAAGRTVVNRGEIIDAAAVAMPPHLAPTARSRTDAYLEAEPADRYSARLEQFANVITIRYEMHQEFA